jgi:hypothetical protein
MPPPWALPYMFILSPFLVYRFLLRRHIYLFEPRVTAVGSAVLFSPARGNKILQAFFNPYRLCTFYMEQLQSMDTYIYIYESNKRGSGPSRRHAGMRDKCRKGDPGFSCESAFARLVNCCTCLLFCSPRTFYLLHTPCCLRARRWR